MKNSQYYDEDGNLKIETLKKRNEREMKFLYRLVFVAFMVFLIIGILIIL